MDCPRTKQRQIWLMAKEIRWCVDLQWSERSVSSRVEWITSWIIKLCDSLLTHSSFVTLHGDTSPSAHSDWKLWQTHRKENHFVFKSFVTNLWGLSSWEEMLKSKRIHCRLRHARVEEAFPFFNASINVPSVLFMWRQCHWTLSAFNSLLRFPQADSFHQFFTQFKINFFEETKKDFPIHSNKRSRSVVFSEIYIYDRFSRSFSQAHTKAGVENR